MQNEMRYLTDDRDQTNLRELVIMQGGNGDWYVAVVPQGQGTMGQAVRICTSGGAARAAPGLPTAIADAYRAIQKKDQPARQEWGVRITSKDLEALADLIHEECSCVPRNNGGGDCDWCRMYYATTDLAEEIKAVVKDLRLQIDSNRRALGQEICEGLRVRGHWAPEDTASSDIIGAVFRVIEKDEAEIKSLKSALEAAGNAMNVLGVKELQHKIQRAIEIFTVNPTGPAAHLMHKALTEGGA